MEADPITEGDNIKEIESDIFMLAGHLAMNEVYGAYKFICIGKRLWNSKQHDHEVQNRPKSNMEATFL